MNGTFHREGGKQHPNPCRATPASLPSATATTTPLALCYPLGGGVQRLHCTPQTCKGMRKLAQAVKWGVMGGLGCPSSARADPSWSSCASTALTVPCPVPAQGHLSQSAWSKVWGRQGCAPGCARAAGLAWHRSFHMTQVAAAPSPVLILSPLSVGTRAHPGLEEHQQGQGRQGCQHRHGTQHGHTVSSPYSTHTGRRRTLGVVAWGPRGAGWQWWQWSSPSCEPGAGC